jgi:hypothetical protein
MESIKCIKSDHFQNRSSNTSPKARLTSIDAAMFLQRSAILAARRAAISPVVRRSFTTSFIRRTFSNWQKSYFSRNPKS